MLSKEENIKGGNREEKVERRQKEKRKEGRLILSEIQLASFELHNRRYIPVSDTCHASAPIFRNQLLGRHV